MLLRHRNTKHYQAHKESARQLVHARLSFFNTFYGFQYKKVFIKNTKSRWGSTSNKGNININYKILFLSQELQDYLIVHELCHLKHFNHGADFWRAVAHTLPNYRAHAKALRRL